MLSKCHDTWQTAAAVIYPVPFINCDDTTQLIFPQPNCCTGAGIITDIVVPTPTPIGTDVNILFCHMYKTTKYFPDSHPQSSSVDGGTIAGAVIGTLTVFMIAMVVGVLSWIKFHKTYRRKQMERIQLDIRAM